MWHVTAGRERQSFLLFLKPNQSQLHEERRKSKHKKKKKHQLLLLLSHFSLVRFCVTPQTAAHQASLSLGFSRQEHWSGLPFPIPMHACMLSRFSRVRLCETPWTVVQQVPLATGFSRQEYWHGMPFPSPQKHQINTEKHIDLLTSSLCDNVKSSN